MTSTVLFHDESESPVGRAAASMCAHVYAYACVPSPSKFFDIALDPVDANDRSSYAPMECIRPLKTVAASFNHNSIECSKFAVFFLSDPPN